MRVGPPHLLSSVWAGDVCEPRLLPPFLYGIRFEVPQPGLRIRRGGRGARGRRGARGGRKCSANNWVMLNTHIAKEGVQLGNHLEEGDPGRGGLQGTRPRAGQLGGPAGLPRPKCVFGQSPVTTDHP
eukprot:1181579-Prorocentrum_minimum.AAC.3